MANWYGTSRTNYFRVKDFEAFKAWVANLDVEIVTDDDGLVGLLCGNDGCWPSWYYDEQSDVDVDIDFTYELSKHLAEGEVAVLVTAGAEKHRYVTGHAAAVNHKGEELCININDIYDLIHAKWGTEVTLAEY